MWIETEAAETVYLVAVTRDKPVKDVLAHIETYLRDQDVDVDRSPRYAPGIGELDPGGHPGDDAP